MHLTLHELDALRYQLGAVEPLAAAARAVLAAEAEHHIAAAEHEVGVVTTDPNERVRREAQAKVHRAMYSYCRTLIANPPLCTGAITLTDMASSVKLGAALTADPLLSAPPLGVEPPAV